MKLEELRNTPKGTKIELSEGNGWYSIVTFNRLIKVTQFPKMTLSQLMNGELSLDKGKRVWEAEVFMEDGKSRIVSPRRLHLIPKWREV